MLTLLSRSSPSSAHMPRCVLTLRAFEWLLESNKNQLSLSYTPYTVILNGRHYSQVLLALSTVNNQIKLLSPWGLHLSRETAKKEIEKIQMVCQVQWRQENWESYAQFELSENLNRMVKEEGGSKWWGIWREIPAHAERPATANFLEMVIPGWGGG